MIPADKIECINISDLEVSREKIVDKLIETGRSRVPVYKNDRHKIIGIVLLKDLSDEGMIEKTIRPPFFVQGNDKVEGLLKEFQQGKTHCAVVVDKNKNFKGLITLEDILEEIVGEILDEYDYKK